MLGAPLDETPEDVARRDIEELADRLQCTRTLATHLARLGFDGDETTRQFLDPKLRDLTPPDAMVDRAVATERLARAIERRERICVFGDYDCDGMTSTAILSDIIDELGGVAIPLLASRFDGGYGVSGPAVRRILDAEPSLLVTCDCGSSDHESLQQIVDEGIDVVVIDHHLVPDRPLPALAFLNPHRPDCGFPEKGLASCGLALSIGAALRTRLHAALDVRKWLDLVAIGSIADVAPLRGDNRALVRAGLRVIREGARPGVRALLELAGLDASTPVTAQDVAFRIAPRLNAPGRLGSPQLALDLLRARDPDRAREIAARIEQLSLQRRELQANMIDEAVAEIEREGYAQRAGIVVGNPGWNHGIVGIVAGRLAEQFHLPVVAFGFEGEVGRGSVRGPKGARLFDALERASEHLERFGGHQAAAGCEVRLSKLGDFRTAFERSCESLAYDSTDEGPSILVLWPGEDPCEVLQDLYQLEPCGEGNPAPVLEVRGRLSQIKEVRGGHLKLDLELLGRRRVSGFGPNLGERARELVDHLEGEVVVTGSLRPDRYRGGDAVELLVQGVTVP